MIVYAAVDGDGACFGARLRASSTSQLICTTSIRYESIIESQQAANNYAKRSLATRPGHKRAHHRSSPLIRSRQFR